MNPLEKFMITAGIKVPVDPPKIVEGWWVPEPYWNMQERLAKYGTYQTVRRNNGGIVVAKKSMNMPGWIADDGRLYVDVVEWRKPEKFFSGPDDHQGRPGN